MQTAKSYNMKHQPAKTHKTQTMEQLNGTKQSDFSFSLLSVVKCCWQAQTKIISTIMEYLLHWLHDRWSPFNQLIISHENPYHNVTNGRQWSSYDPFSKPRTIISLHQGIWMNCRVKGDFLVGSEDSYGHLEFTLNTLQVSTVVAFSFPLTS